ncbi:hypothetical protein SAMN05192558_104352 [Actinokineospora alba]|uniref:Uncharacterized protein n=1 Tax=Actinokineospora alba TaxID=504798 RepID=A0A1H0LZM9_9PSEU|nr:hypothetical protein [Actinokineospora alba]TDP67523.1 hypothetical protein C8E96_3069 [Actinokineospora alba]SDI46478.1 hypothetical protein SAMN05421871_105108 [Actinokineospora alba]SDO73583.1 hypothetical protein SAMN05192558_104352 [Actinokineospora alba]
MLSTQSFRFSAVCGVLAGLLIAIPGLYDGLAGETALTSFLLGLSPAFAIPLAVALHLRQSHVQGGFGAVAYGVNMVGLGLFAGAVFTLNMAFYFLDDATVAMLRQGPTNTALLLAGAVFAVGSVLFSVSLVRAKVFPTVPAWGYMSVVLLPVAARLPESPATGAVHTVVGATMVWLGIALWTSLSRES